MKEDEFIVSPEGDYEALSEGAVDRFTRLDITSDGVRIRVKSPEDDLCS